MTRPSDALSDVIDRRNARLLLAITLVLPLLTLLGGAQARLFMYEPHRTLVSQALLACALGYGIAHAVARTRAYRIAFVATLALQAATPVFITSRVGASHEVAALTLGVWLSMPVLTSAIQMSFRAILALGAGCAALVVATVVLVWRASAAFAIHPILVLASATTIVALVVRHRDALESIRQLQILEKKQALERLRDSLELRVARRTHELTTSHVALQRAYATLQANERALLKTERMAFIGRLTAGVAHEMSSPLSALACTIHDLARLVDEYEQSIGDTTVLPEDHRAVATEMRQAVDLARQCTERSTNFVRSIKTHTRVGGAGKRESFDPNATVRDALNLLTHAAHAARCTLAFDPLAGSAPIEGDPNRLGQAVTNLVHNAIDAVAEKGSGHVHVALREVDDELQIQVRDDGPGIGHDALGRIFEPLFTTKPYGKGTGLGLAITKEVVEAEFKGRIDVETAPNEGCLFTIHLPRTRGAQSAA